MAQLCGLDEPKHIDYKRAATEFQELETHRERDNIMSLFTEPTGYDEAELLTMFKSVMKQHHISKWGAAVPIVDGNYDLLLGFHFSERYLGAFAHFLPSYAVDAQTSINVRLLPDGEPDGVITKLIWNQSTDAMLRHVREELLDDGLHPVGVFDSAGICQRLRKTLMLREEARTFVGQVRSDIGAVICMVGNDLVLTTKGIENLKLRSSEPIPFWAAFKRAGLKTKRKREVFVPDQRWFDKSGFADHLEIPYALTALRVLYKSRFLSGASRRGLAAFSVRISSASGRVVGIP